MRNRFVLWAILACLVPITTLAQRYPEQPPKVSADTVAPSKVADQKPAETPTSNGSPGLNEAALYKLLYESQKEANKDLAQVIYWSTTLVGAFLLTIVGSQVFFNYRLRKSDVANLQKSNAKQVSDAIEVARTEFLQLIKSSESENRSSREELSKYFSGRFDAVSDRIETARKSIDDVASKLTKVEPLQDRISSLEMNMSELDGHVWRLRGVESNALTGFIKACELQIENNRVKTLYYGLREVEAALKKMDSIYSNDYHRLCELMQKLPEGFHEERERITAMFEKLPMYELDLPEDPRGRAVWRYVKNAPDKE